MFIVSLVEVGGVSSKLSAKVLSSLVMKGVGEVGTDLSSRALKKTSRLSSSIISMCFRIDGKRRGGRTNKYIGTLPDDCSGWRHPILNYVPTQADLTMVKRWSRRDTLAFFAMC
jgi:hypothetical protein